MRRLTMAICRGSNAEARRQYADWQKQLAPYRGARIVTYHKDFVYSPSGSAEHRRRARGQARHRTVRPTPRPGIGKMK